MPLAPPTPAVRARARKGLLVYGVLTLVGTAIVDGMIIARGGPITDHVALVVALMWTPCLSSIVTRLVLREGFADVSFRLGGWAGARAIGVSLLYPIVVGLIGYGIAWAAGLVTFEPPAIFVALEDQSPFVRFLAFLGATGTVGVLFSAVTAAGEEIGWRGYMLTRLVDAGVPRPVLVCSLVWFLWHTPLIISGQYSPGEVLWLSLLVFFVQITAASYVMAHHRFSTGSVWPAIVLHSAWNSNIQGAFDGSSHDPGIWVGESGVLVGAACIVVSVLLVLKPVAFRRSTKDAPSAERLALLSRG